ncbi:hypothetical protein Dip510_000843 [Elusimicrobium posterum]|uniref:hypothetical protein n=1 Tax=Elusimicrobium posterum TaxID=3116653 RepID=UPI003C785F5D
MRPLTFFERVLGFIKRIVFIVVKPIYLWSVDAPTLDAYIAWNVYYETGFFPDFYNPENKALQGETDE